MSPDVSNIDSGKKYNVEIDGTTFTVEGSEIISAACPKCHGAGLVAEKGTEPQMCPLCDGMGMYDYSQAAKIDPA